MRIDNIDFRFFLNFKNDATGRKEISEPFGFDSATFTIEQDKARYGRDVTYGSENVELEFYDGVYSNGLTHCFEDLINYYNVYGFESEVEFIISKDGIDFIVGVLDFQFAETDQITYLKCKTIQNTNQSIVKRREDVNVDVFSNKDLDDNDITPVTTHNILLKAKPINQVSEWQYSSYKWYIDGQNNYYYAGLPRFFFANRLLTKYGIENSLTPFDVEVGSLEQVSEEFGIIEASNQLSNIKINYKIKAKYEHVVNNNPDPFGNGIRTFLQIGYAILRFGDSSISFTDITSLIRINVTDPFNRTLIIDEDINVNVDETLNQGDKLIFLYRYEYTQRTSDVNILDLSRNSHIIFYESNLQITATSTAINSVITGVRHIDYIKQAVKSASGLNVIAPKYEVGGQFYNNFVFNGKLIRQFTNEPFYATIKDNFSQLIELNSDFQINENEVYVSQYNDFYPNFEVASFMTAPDKTFKTKFNEMYAVQTLEYKYKTFEQDKDSENTIDAVHTDTQWLLPNKNVEGKLKYEIDFIRDPFKIEFARTLLRS
jgi:hypothetical protein